MIIIRPFVILIDFHILDSTIKIVSSRNKEISNLISEKMNNAHKKVFDLLVI